MAGHGTLEFDHDQEQVARSPKSLCEQRGPCSFLRRDGAPRSEGEAKGGEETLHHVAARDQGAGKGSPGLDEEPHYRRPARAATCAEARPHAAQVMEAEVDEERHGPVPLELLRALLLRRQRRQQVADYFAVVPHGPQPLVPIARALSARAPSVGAHTRNQLDGEECGNVLRATALVERVPNCQRHVSVAGVLVQSTEHYTEAILARLVPPSAARARAAEQPLGHMGAAMRVCNGAHCPRRADYIAAVQAQERAGDGPENEVEGAFVAPQRVRDVRGPHMHVPQKLLHGAAAAAVPRAGRLCRQLCRVQQHVHILVGLLQHEARDGGRVHVEVSLRSGAEQLHSRVGAEGRGRPRVEQCTRLDRGRERHLRGESMQHTAHYRCVLRHEEALLVRVDLLAGHARHDPENRLPVVQAVGGRGRRLWCDAKVQLRELPRLGDGLGRGRAEPRDAVEQRGPALDGPPALGGEQDAARGAALAMLWAHGLDLAQPAEDAGRDADARRPGRRLAVHYAAAHARLGGLPGCKPRGARRPNPPVSGSRYASLDPPLRLPCHLSAPRATGPDRLALIFRPYTRS